MNFQGIGSKLMLAMGYVPGTGLGVEGDGRLQPVEARVLPVGKSLDHCMAISEKHSLRDPLKVCRCLYNLLIVVVEPISAICKKYSFEILNKIAVLICECTDWYSLHIFSDHSSPVTIFKMSIYPKSTQHNILI